MSAYKQSLEAFLLQLQRKDRIEGTLQLKAQDGKIRFFHFVDGSRRYLASHEMSSVRALAQKRYELEVMKACGKAIEAIGKCLENLESCKDPEDVYNGLSAEMRDLVKPVYVSLVDVNRWMKRRYPSHLGFSRNAPVIHARNGLRVRSKTEEILVNLFLDLGIPFLYEFPMIINGELIYPDFRILNVRTGKEYIYEHFGKMDDPTYVEQNMMHKLSLYQMEGIFLGDKLLATFETSKTPADELYLMQFIKKYFL